MKTIHRFRRQLLGLVVLIPLSVGASVSSLHGCEVEPDLRAEQRQELLRDTVSIVIVPSYAALADRCDQLVAALAALSEAPSASTLEDAQDAFRAARSALKVSEAFAFGPAEDLELTGGAIDSWPANGAKLDALLAEGDALELATIERLGANARGFPALEYLLFDSGATQGELAMRFTEDEAAGRRATLAHLLAQDLVAHARAVFEAWDPAHGNFAKELAEAGVDSANYARQREGIDELVTGMLYLAELMAESKLAKPLGLDQDGESAPQLEEAPRSDGSLAHLRDNLRGLESVYLCRRGEARGTESMSAAVKRRSPEVDQRFREALKEARAAVDASPSSFREALVADKAAITRIYDRVRVIKQLVATEIASALGASIGFGYSDTD